MPNIDLIQGDCLVELAKLPANSIDMIFADPPYNLSNDGFTVMSGKRVSVNKGKWDKSLGIIADMDFHIKWISACQRVLKPNGTIWVSGTYHSIYQCGYALQKLDFHILNDISWFKPNASPNIGCRCFAASHETILWAKKSKNSKHTFNYQLMKNYDEVKDIIKNSGKQMRSVWSIPTTPQREKIFGKHPTQKPIELLKRIILSSTNEENLVLDPFIGSGTTGVVCQMLNRNFIGFELETEFIELSRKRINHLNNLLL
jgi:site-specific DNA-methyltransferase (adenine-specific)